MGHKTRSRKREAAARSQHPGLFRSGSHEPARTGAASPRSNGSVALASAQEWVRWLVPLLVVLCTLAAFLPTLQNHFVNWDDDKNFLDNHHYRGLTWQQLSWMWTTHLGHYIPLTWMTLGMDYLLWGMNPVGYHLTSLLLHATSAVVFFFLARRFLTLALPRASGIGHALTVSAGFAALVFAIHPLRVESVAWVTERRDVLSGLFFLLTILVYLRSCERPELGRWWYGLSVALFGCALLSKSMAVSLPVVLLILEVYPLRRLGGSLGWASASARRVYVEKIPFVLLAAAASALALLAQLSSRAMVSVAHLSALDRLVVSAYGLSFYLWKTVVPLNLSPLYMLPQTVNPAATPFIVSYGGVLAVTAIALALRRRWPGLPAAWLAYVVVLLPVLGIAQSGPQIAADRYTYLAALGWAILAGAGLLSCWRLSTSSTTGAPATWGLAGIATGVVIALGVLTWNQVQVWHDSERLWTHALAVDPNSFMAHNNLGYALDRQGKLAEAIEHYRQALRIKPDYAEAHNNVGHALDGQGKSAEAIEHFQQALRIQPETAEAHVNWGLALDRQGKPAEAIEHLQQALRIQPENAEAHSNWGVVLGQQGKPAEAIGHFQQALRIKPDYSEAHSNWGVVLGQQGKPADAIEHFRQALRIQPENAETHNNWGVALTQQGKPAEAIEHFRRALRIQPENADAHNNLARALAQQDKAR